MNPELNQEAGSNSTNYQAAGDITIGLSYEQAKEVALDVFKANFYELSETAKRIAVQRAEEITDSFIQRFYQEVPELKKKLEEPAIQSSIFEVQKAYAKTGDKDLEKILLDTLIERINSDERSLRQVVLDEALYVLPKLTVDQINILSLIFAIAYVKHYDVVTLLELKRIINRLVKFLPTNVGGLSFVSHLQFVGCCVEVASHFRYSKMNEFFKDRFRGLLSIGFELEDFLRKTNQNTNVHKIVIPCLHNKDRFQISALNEETLDKIIEENFLGSLKPTITKFWIESTMRDSDINNYLNSLNPDYAKISLTWEKSTISRMKLTSVGLVIALINFNKITSKAIGIDEVLKQLEL